MVMIILKDIVFLIGGKEHHYHTINKVKYKYLVKKIIYKRNDLLELNNSFIFVIGSKIIPENIITKVNKNNNILLNLHSGDTKKYRGMDCEYWSLFYNDNIICTLHRIDKKIDGGIIYIQRKVDLKNVKNIKQLKIAISDTYADLIIDFLKNCDWYIDNCKEIGNGKYYKSIGKNILNVINNKLKKGEYNN